LLASLGAEPVLRPVNVPGARRDVVLEQDPEPGTMVHEGQTVYYTVRPSGNTRLPEDWRCVDISYTVPQSPYPRQVRVDTVDRKGLRHTWFPRQKDYIDGSPPRIEPGYTVHVRDLLFKEEITVEIFLDGVKVRTYYYKGDSEPVITEYNEGGAGAVPRSARLLSKLE